MYVYIKYIKVFMSIYINSYTLFSSFIFYIFFQCFLFYVSVSVLSFLIC